MGTQPSKPISADLLDYLKQISDEEKTQLMDFIANDDDEQAIKLSCELINKKRKGPNHGALGVLHVPQKQCRQYGVYMYQLFKDAYWHRKNKAPAPFHF